MDIPRRFTQRSGPSLPSWERIHIYRDPPKSVFTRKKERVDEADVMYMTRPDGPSSDPSRINQGVQYFQRGVNPSVEVNYQNFGAGGSRSSSGDNTQAGSIYKLDVVRPPINPVETLLPLSRPRTHQNKVVESNPGLTEGNNSNTLAYDFDNAEVQRNIIDTPSGPRTVQATAYYKIEAPNVMSAKWAINENVNQAYDVMANPTMPVQNTDDFVCREQTPYGVIVRPLYSVGTNPSQQRLEERNDQDVSNAAKKEILMQNINPNFQIVIYDPSNHVSSEVSASIAERNNIAVQASIGQPISLTRDDGTPIKLKDYNWTAVNTNVGNDTLIITVQDPEVELERNLPLYAAQPNIYVPTNIVDLENTEYNFDSKVMTEGVSNPGLDININKLENYDYDLESKIQTGAYTNVGTANDLLHRQNKNVQLDGRVAPDLHTNLFADGYDDSNSRHFQNINKYQKQTSYQDWNVPANSMPTNMRTQPQIRLKETSHQNTINKSSFERLFE
jgi:hypothetical protein